MDDWYSEMSFYLLIRILQYQREILERINEAPRVLYARPFAAYYYPVKKENKK